MKTKCLFLYVLVVFAICSPSVRVYAQSNPVSICFVPDHDHAFWITNNTDKIVFISLLSIERKTLSEWKSYSEPTGNGPGLLYFSSRNRKTGFLNPHDAGYGQLLGQGISFPNDCIWRVKVSVQEELTGRARVEAIVEAQNDLQRARDKTGNTNIPVISAFDPDTHVCGPTQVIHSDAFQSL